MTTVQRLHVRWSGADARRRAALLDALLRDALPDALASLGAGVHGDVCVRRVWVPPIVADATERDEDIVGRWAGCVADAIAAGIRDGEAVVFRSPNHALADMALGVARGQLERAWAWRAAGVWPAGVAGPGPEPGPPSSPPAPLRSAPTDAAGRRRPGEGTAGAGGGDRVRAAEPGDAGAPAATTAAPLPFGDRPAHAGGDGDRGVSSSPGGSGVVSPGDAGAAAPAAEGGGPAAVWSAVDVDRAAEALASALVARPEATQAVLAHVERVGLRPALEARLGVERTAVLPASGGAAQLRRAADVVPEAWTPWGGLLFLLHLVDPATAHLHALGTALLTPLLREHEHLSPRDPALLAFAGLAPDDDPPDPPERHRPDPRPVLARLHELGLDIGHVCRRAAVVVADPGWIEARYSLDGVDLDIRRACLDLDPGWLPWLGVVVRFHYG